jgi:hypothetical protein
MVEIVGGVIAPVQNNQSQQDNPRRPPFPRKRTPKDKRNNVSDRRQAVRHGIVVTLSTKVERREEPDRRKD